MLKRLTTVVALMAALSAGPATAQDAVDVEASLATATSLLSEVEHSPSANLNELRAKLQKALEKVRNVLQADPHNDEALQLMARIDERLALLAPTPHSEHPWVAEAEATLDRLAALLKGGAPCPELAPLRSHLEGLLPKLDPATPEVADRFRQALRTLDAAGRCAAADEEHPVTLPPEIHAESAGGVTAHFGGEQLPDEFDPRFGVTALWFTFPGDEAVYRFTPGGELFFSDWRFDVFSPDGTHVLLLQSHTGPYHVVKTAGLKDYLTGRAAPNHILTKATAAGEPALIHSEGRWISPREIAFIVACCGTQETVTYLLREN